MSRRSELSSTTTTTNGASVGTVDPEFPNDTCREDPSKLCTGRTVVHRAEIARLTRSGVGESARQGGRDAITARMAAAR